MDWALRISFSRRSMWILRIGQQRTSLRLGGIGPLRSHAVWHNYVTRHPFHNTSTTLLAQSMDVKLWCYIKGDGTCFDVSIPPTQSISHLRERIFEKGRNSFNVLDAKNLILKKVDIALDDVEDIISAGQYQPNANSQRLRPSKKSVTYGPCNPPIIISTFS
ncbi:hypothetical protein BC827DRAFT_53345 [Russula dissimulans]|nr:hypothetical protein BC827DRAFT_53345 [Russula dissimulans]